MKFASLISFSSAAESLLELEDVANCELEFNGFLNILGLSFKVFLVGSEIKFVWNVVNYT